MNRQDAIDRLAELFDGVDLTFAIRLLDSLMKRGLSAGIALGVVISRMLGLEDK